MKKTVYMILMFMLLTAICLSGCDSNSGKRPNDYENTVWQAQSIDFTFWVDDKYYDTTGTNTYGILVVDDIEIPVFLLFAYNNRVSVMPLSSRRIEIRDGKEGYSVFSDEYLFEGIGSFEKTSFTISISDDRGCLPAGTTELTFLREDTE